MPKTVSGYWIVPNEVGRDHVWLWIAYVGPDKGSTEKMYMREEFVRRPSDLEILVLGSDGSEVSSVPLSGADWRQWMKDNFAILYRRDKIRIPIGAQDQELTFRLVYSKMPDDEYGNKARVTPLPKVLPRATSKEAPFRILAGSCFSAKDENARRSGRVSYAVEQLDQKPDIKFLTGDQVYLDPVPDRETSKYGKRLFKRYYDSWELLLPILSHGSNYFAADDHEVWNNYPEEGLTTAGMLRKDTWKRLATELFNVFQCPHSRRSGTGANGSSPNRRRTYARTFAIPLRGGGHLNFFKAEVRMNRQKGENKFMTDGDLFDLRIWAKDLDGPGVLVLSQPLFERKPPAGENGLAQFAQHGELLGYLRAAQHDVIVVTGDMHYGRLARMPIDERRHNIFEVMSSPMRQLKNASNEYKDGSLIDGAAMETAWGGDHFVTLDFAQPSGNGAVRMQVTAHSTGSGKKGARDLNRAPFPGAGGKYLVGNYTLT